MTNAVVICARQSSERLAGKALVDLCGKPVLQHIVERYQSSARIERVIVATSRLSPDDDIERLCVTLRVPCYRGNLNNVVARMDGAIKMHAPDAEYVFRGLGDMPLFDVDLLDWRFDLLRRHDADVVWTGLQDDPWPVYGSRESPWSRRAWDRIAVESTGEELEHPGLWLYMRIQKRGFFVIHTEGLLDEYYRPYRLELDTAEDLAFFEKVFKWNYDGPGTPRTLDALRWLDVYPEVVAINAGVEEKTLMPVNWRKRGVAWSCSECGAAPMRTGVIRHGDLVTECSKCGESRIFKAVPAFLAERGKR